jgi:3-hydroxyisobutyrate dehydrogenase-like beta-hydroxyacid dehydrogenase
MQKVEGELTKQLGFIGTGKMGSPMVRNLLRAGYALRVYDPDPRQVAPLVDLGAQAVSSPGETVDEGGIVFSMVPDDEALKEIIFGDEGLLCSLGAGGIHVSMSTVSPGLAEQCAKLYARQGSAYLSAPVFGRPDVAEGGKLAIFLSGAHTAKERVLPHVSILGQHIFDFGEDAQAASVIKIAGNFLIAAALESMAEAAALVEKYGIERSHFMEMIGMTLFNCPVYRGYGPMIAEHRYHPALFRVPLGLKDVNLCMAAAQKAGVPMPLAHLVLDRLQVALNRERAALDWSALALGVSEDAGLL